MSETSSNKHYYILKTNGVMNIRSINASLSAAPEIPNFWLAGIMAPRKVRKNTVLRKEFLFYDYAFLELEKPYEFEKFITDKGIPAYFLHLPGSKVMAYLSDEEIKRIKDLEIFKQLEVSQFNKKILIKPGAYIEVVNGPFIGCKGVVLAVAHSHIILEMNVFGRPTRVNIGKEFLEGLLENYTVDKSDFLDE